MEKSVVKKLTALNLIILLIICIVFTCVIINNNYFTKTVKAETNDAQEIQLNTKYTVTLEKGSQKHFTIDITDNSYYVVETRGDLQVRVQVDYNGKRYSDFTSGVDYNGCIGFVGANTTVEITLQNVFIWNTGTTELQVRKQQAVLYGFNYIDTVKEKGEINTVPCLNVPYNILNGKYQTYKFTDNEEHDLGHIISTETSRGYKRLNSEIVYFDGHGDVGMAIFPDTALYATTITDMENCKLAVWSSCYSAATNDTFPVSLAEKSVIAGARTSIGWPDSIYVSSSKIFIDRLFNKLDGGATIEEACSYAKDGIIWVWDSVRDYQIFGDKQATIMVNDFDKINPNYSENTLSNISINSEILQININRATGLNKEDYIVLSAGTNVNRCYYMINGYPTNLYFDTTKDGYLIANKQEGEINTLSYNKVLPINITPNIINQSTLNNKGYLLDHVERHTVYYIKDNVATPIEIQYLTYKSNSNIFYDVNCLNLFNGKLIDYADICS